MLTVEGKNHIRRYLAGLTPSIAQSIAIGLGDQAEAVGDTRLQFEVGRNDIILTSFDFVNSRLIFKATVPAEIAGEVREVGLYSTLANQTQGEYGSALITTFDSATEDWINVGTSVASTFVASGRIGEDSMNQLPAANGNQTDALQELFLDLSGYSAADRFVFAFNVNNTFTSSIRFRFMTDSANYYDITLGSQTGGYKIVEATKASAVATGTPDWGNITELRVTSFSTAGGSSSVNFDGIRIEDVDTVNPDYVLVSREVLATPFIKEEGKVQEVEFSLDVNL